MKRHAPIVLVVLLLLPVCAFAQFGQPPAESAKPADTAKPDDAPPATEPPKAGDPATATDPAATDPAATEDAADESSLPHIDDMPLPSVEDLVKGPQVDWIVLMSGEVIVAQPVYPRPSTLEQINEKIEKSYENPPKSPEARRRLAAQRDEWKTLVILLPGDDAAEYTLNIDEIQEIRLHEDLVLLRVRKLIDEGDLRGAYELLFPLARKSPDWPRLDEAQNNLLLAQARKRLAEDRPQEALVYVEELCDRKRSFPGVQKQLAEVLDTLITSSVDADDFRRARYFLARFRKRLPSNDLVVKWTGNLDARALALADEARAASEAGKHDEAAALATRAAIVWPSAQGVRELYRSTTNRWQTLNVGVRRNEHVPLDLPLRSPVRERHESLVESPLFRVAAVDHRAVYVQPDVESWEPTDLGRTLEFSLRRNRERWESLSPLTSSDVTASIRDRLDPGRDEYDERLAGFVSAVRVSSPYRFAVEFRRTPLRPEALLDVTTRATPGDAGESGTRGRFHVHAADDEEVVYRRSTPEPDDLKVSEYHVAEIVERPYGSWDDAAQGLLRGEVDLVTHLRPFEADLLAGDERFEVRRYALPRTHVLQFNWENPALRNQSFRRCLAFATNARRVMREAVLRSENSPYGRLVTAPWSSTSVAYDRTLAPREYDFPLSIALRLAAAKELGALPPLTLLVLGDDVALAAAHEIVKDWERSGIVARVITEAEYVAMSEPHWDVLYRTVKMQEPAVELWPFVASADTARVEDLETLPDWLRQQLVALDLATSWPEAEGRLRDLQRGLYEEARFIPLWEVEDHFVLRNTLRPATSRDARAMDVYEDVERWIVRPAYPTEVE